MRACNSLEPLYLEPNMSVLGWNVGGCCILPKYLRGFGGESEARWL